MNRLIVLVDTPRDLAASATVKPWFDISLDKGYTERLDIVNGLVLKRNSPLSLDNAGTRIVGRLPLDNKRVWLYNFLSEVEI